MIYSFNVGTLGVGLIGYPKLETLQVFSNDFCIEADNFHVATGPVNLFSFEPSGFTAAWKSSRKFFNISRSELLIWT